MEELFAMLVRKWGTDAIHLVLFVFLTGYVIYTNFKREISLQGIIRQQSKSLGEISRTLDRISVRLDSVEHRVKKDGGQFSE